MYGVGDYFGETSLLTGDLRNADISAYTRVVCGTLSKPAFLDVCRRTNIGDGFLKLASMRKAASWQVINANSVMSLMSSSQKTAIETIVSEEAVEEGALLWEISHPANFAFLVISGKFSLFKARRERRRMTAPLPSTIGKLGRAASMKAFGAGGGGDGADGPGSGTQTPNPHNANVHIDTFERGACLIETDALFERDLLGTKVRGRRRGCPSSPPPTQTVIWRAEFVLRSRALTFFRPRTRLRYS